MLLQLFVLSIRLIATYSATGYFIIWRKRANCLKKKILYVLFILVGIVAGIVISNVLYVTMGHPFFPGTPEAPAPDAKMDNLELTSLAYTVLGYISDGDYAALSRVAHPEFGVVFSPDATVALATNKCFRADQIASFGTDQTVYFWGVNEGTGEPINLTASSYFSDYITACDYSGASIIGVNRIVKSGNALENMLELFPDVKFVDFHIPGGEKDSAGDYGWTSLRLGFEEYEGKLWLAVIINSRWTV